jgi:hypothetical protein
MYFKPRKKLLKPFFYTNFVLIIYFALIVFGMISYEIAVATLTLDTLGISFVLVMLVTMVIAFIIVARKRVIPQLKLRRLATAAIALILIPAALITPIQITTEAHTAHAWWSLTGSPPDRSTHPYTFGRALDILINDLGGDFGEILVTNRQNLYKYVQEPDVTQTHRNAHLYPGARRRMNANYAIAVQQYKNGETDEAIKSIGYAIHYLQDLLCPVHAASISDRDYSPTTRISILLRPTQWNKTPHRAYELWVLEHQKAFEMPETATSFYGIFRNGFASLNETIELSRELGKQIAKHEGNETIYTQATEQILPIMVQYLAAFLEQFLYDIA